MSCESGKVWYQKNKEKALKRGKDWYWNNKEEANEKRRERRREVKILVMEHYGGFPPKCACCGEELIEFLCIDHVNGGGEEHRRKVKVRSGIHFYYWLLRNKFPPGFRVLCHNCNMALGAYGYCPHEKEQKSEL